MKGWLAFSRSLIFLASLFQALDTFSAAIVSPVYYVMFTTLTIIASAIMFKVRYLECFRECASDATWCFFNLHAYREMMSWHLLLSYLSCAGLVWSEYQQHSLWDMWIHHCTFRNNHTSRNKRTGTTSYTRYSLTNLHHLFEWGSTL